MSEVIKKIDAKAASLIDAADDRGRSGSSLLAPLDLEEQLEAVLKWMRGPRAIDLPGGGYDKVPRFGLLSLILQQTQVFVYDHPELLKISQTAFTDGIHVFLSAGLFDLMNESVAKNPSTFGIEWVINHEIMHKLFNHVRRLKNFPHDIANEATDLSINTKLVEGYPDLKPCPKLLETGLGFKPGDPDRWMHLSEEAIAMELQAMRGLNKKRKVESDPNQQQGQKGQQGQQGQQGGGQQSGGQQSGDQSGGQQGQQGGQKGGGQSGGQQENNDPLSDLDDPQGGGKPGQDEPSQDDQHGQDGKGSGGQNEESAAEKKGPSDVWGDPDDTHFIPPEDLIKVLEDAGLDNVKEKLELPDSDDLESIGEMQEATRRAQQEAIMQAQTQMARLGGSYPGAHIVEAAGEMVKDFGKAKVTWRLASQEALLGGSTRFAPTMEEPHELFYVSGMEEVLGMQPYFSSMMPHENQEVALFLVDTSGSMSNKAMSLAVTEGLELKTAAHNAGDTAATVYIWPCDTVLRGEPHEVTEQNVDEFLQKGVEMRGRGGTDIATCINQALSHPLIKNQKVRAIVYASDLEDNPVTKKPEMLEEHPEIKVVFLGDPETSPAQVETFAKGTKWADVYVIEDALDIDFDDVGEQAVSPKMRRKGMRP